MRVKIWYAPCAMSSAYRVTALSPECKHAMADAYLHLKVKHRLGPRKSMSELTHSADCAALSRSRSNCRQAQARRPPAKERDLRAISYPNPLQGVPEDESLPPRGGERHAPTRIGVGAKLKIQCKL